MAILCFLGIWVLYLWLVRKCVRRAGVHAGDRNARQRRPRVQIPDNVPSEWIEAYRAENDA